MQRWMMALLIAMCVLAVQAQTGTRGLSAQQREILEKLMDMTPEQQQAFAARMQAESLKSQACFADIDPARIDALETRSRAVGAKLKALCDSGNLAEAEAYASEEGRKMANDPTARRLAECSNELRDRMVFMPWTQVASGGSVCPN